MKKHLIQIDTALAQISTHGQDTLIMADVRKLLTTIIKSIPDNPVPGTDPEEGKEDE